MAPLACSAKLAARALLRRTLLRWLEAAACSAYLSELQSHAAAFHRHRLLAAWLARWRLATQRSQLLAERERQRRRQRALAAWQAWRAYCQECVVRRGLEAAAGLHRECALLRRCLGAWRTAVATHRQVDLPAEHPAMRGAARLQRARLLRTFFCAWRVHLADTVLPRLAAVQVRVLEHFMGSQRRAFAAWQHYVQQRREARVLQASWQGPAGQPARAKPPCCCAKVPSCIASVCRCRPCFNSPHRSLRNN